MAGTGARLTREDLPLTADLTAACRQILDGCTATPIVRTTAASSSSGAKAERVAASPFECLVGHEAGVCRFLRSAGKPRDVVQDLVREAEPPLEVLDGDGVLAGSLTDDAENLGEAIAAVWGPAAAIICRTPAGMVPNHWIVACRSDQASAVSDGQNLQSLAETAHTSPASVRGTAMTHVARSGVAREKSREQTGCGFK